MIAAAYADADALDPPALAPAWLPELVERAGISGALVDTFVKDGRGLYGWLSEPELADLIARTRGAGASFGVAGQLTRGELRRVPADVVGVRSAVCRGGDRAAELDAELVAAAVAELRAGRPVAQPGMIRVPGGVVSPADPRRLRSPHHDRHAGAAHGLGQVGVHGSPAAASLQRLQLGGGQRGQRRVVRRPPRQHPGHRLEQHRLVGADRGGRQHRQRVARHRPGLRHLGPARERRRRQHQASARGATRSVSSSAPGSSGASSTPS